MRKFLVWGLSLLWGLTVFASVPAQAELYFDEDNDTEEVSDDYLTADIVEQIREEAMRGRPDAQLALGVWYLEGCQYLPKEVEKACLWLQKAADNNSLEAAALLGALYFTGEDFPQDFEKANEYLGHAARKGHPASQYLYAMMCAMGIGREADIDEARIWMNTSAENGDEDAQEFLRDNPEWIK